MTTAASIHIPIRSTPEQQRLGATLTLSVLIHAMLIAGVGFTISEPAALVPTLDVIFSQAASELTPEQADFLASANNVGGGEHDEARRPRDAQTGLLPQLQHGTTPIPQPEQTQAPVPQEAPRVVSSHTSDIHAVRAQPTPPAIQPTLKPVDHIRERRHAEMARLAAEVHVRSEHYAKRPNRKFVSASTKEYAYASYLRAWVDKAERVGNLNYPDQARQRRLGGQVIITVGVRRDGSVDNAKILQSSGLPVLDDAALRIAHLASPFPPLPRTNDGVDILQVTRTWNFLPGGELRDIDR